MKSKIITLCCLAMSISVFAQEKITVDESPQPMSKGTYPAYITEIPGAKLKDVERDWKRYITSGSKGRVLEANDEISIIGAVNKNISQEPFNVYSHILETTTGVKLTAWLTFKDSVYISKDLNTDKDLAAQKYIRDFGVQEYKLVVKGELQKQNEMLRLLQDQQNDLIKAEEHSNKKIEEYERDIQKNNGEIATNADDQKRKADLISNQKGVVESTRDNPEDNKAAIKTLKDLEGDQNKLVKNGEKLNKEIDNWNREIREEQRKIEAGKADQKLKIDAIEKQKQSVQEVEDKLKNIQ